MQISPQVNMQAFIMLIFSINFWINTPVNNFNILEKNVQITNSYWKIIWDLYLKYRENVAEFININRILDMLETLGSQKSGFSCCKIDQKNSMQILLNLWVKLDPLSKILKFLILENKSKLEQNLSMILILLIKKPYHCVFLAIIKIINELSENHEIVEIINNLKGYHILLYCANNYSSDILLYCLEITRKTYYFGIKDISSKVSFLFTNEKSRINTKNKQKLRKTPNLETIKIGLLTPKFLFKKRSKSFDSYKPKLNKPKSIIRSEKLKENNKISGQTEIIYKYLKDLSIASYMKYTQNIKHVKIYEIISIIGFQWMIDFLNKTENYRLSIKFLNLIEEIAMQNYSENYKIVFNCKGLTKLLLKTEEKIFSKNNMELIKSLTNLHSRLWIKAIKNRKFSLEFIIQHELFLTRGQLKYSRILLFVWKKVINFADLSIFRYQVYFTFKFALAIMCRKKDIKNDEKKLLFSKTNLFGDNLFPHIFNMIQEFFEEPVSRFISLIKLTNQSCNESYNKILMNMPEKTIKQITILYTMETMPNDSNAFPPLEQLRFLLVILLQHVNNKQKLLKILNFAEHFVTYLFVLLEFSRRNKLSNELELIEDNIINIISILIKKMHSSEEHNINELFANCFVKIMISLTNFITESKIMQGCFDFYMKNFKCTNQNYLISLKENYEFTEICKQIAENTKQLEKYETNFLKISDMQSDTSLDYLALSTFFDNSKNTPPIADNKILLKITEEFLHKYEPEFKQKQKKLLFFLLTSEIHRRSCQHKWKKVFENAKQWRGFWRDKSIFDNAESISKIPYKLMSHHFKNSMKCIQKIRPYAAKYLDTSCLHKFMYSEGRSEENFNLLKFVTCYEATQRNIDTICVNLSKIQEIIWDDLSSIVELQIRYTDSEFQKYLLPRGVDCEIFNFLFAKRGKIMLNAIKNEAYIKFVFEDLYGKNENTARDDKRLMFTYFRSKDEPIIKKWCIKDLVWIYLKQIVDRKTGVELVFDNGRSVLVNFFEEKHRETFVHAIMQLREKVYKEKSDIILDGIKGLEKLRLTQDWLWNQISTFDYLLGINMLSSRSFNNSAQYPVFPWVLKDYQSTNLSTDLNQNPEIYRDFTKTVGMMGNPARAESFKERYNQADLTGLGHFNYGSHYSNPGLVMQFTMRLYPFYEGYVQFFTGLDDPNRMFNSMAGIFKCACNDPSDVRELIPEFFGLPELLINAENHNFGVRDLDKIKVDSVILPPYANNSIYEFIHIHRNALESNITSVKISHWIDLIFGYKQRGEEAVKACNVFPLLTTETEKVLAECYGELKAEYRYQAYHWGQTPQQLFFKPHNQRPNKKNKLICEQNTEIQVITNTKIKKESDRTTRETFSGGDMLKTSMINFEKSKIKVIAAKILYESPNDVRFIMISMSGHIFVREAMRNEANLIIYTIQPPKMYSNCYISQQGYRALDSIFLSENSTPPIALITKRHDFEQIVQGGYLDGSIRITSPINPNISNIVHTGCSTVTAIKTDFHEQMVIIGCAKGESLIYAVGDKDLQPWIPKYFMQNHAQRISHIDISQEMLLFSTASHDGTVNLYNKSYHPKLIRTIRHPESLQVNFVILAMNPVPCIVIYSEIDEKLHCFSINGHLLYSISENKIISPILGRNNLFQNCLVYINPNENQIIVRKLPTLEKVKEKELEKEPCLICTTENQMFLLLIFDDATAVLACAK